MTNPQVALTLAVKIVHYQGHDIKPDIVENIAEELLKWLDSKSGITT